MSIQYIGKERKLIDIHTIDQFGFTLQSATTVVDTHEIVNYDSSAIYEVKILNASIFNNSTQDIQFSLGNFHMFIPSNAYVTLNDVTSTAYDDRFLCTVAPVSGTIPSGSEICVKMTYEIYKKYI